MPPGHRIALISLCAIAAIGQPAVATAATSAVPEARSARHDLSKAEVVAIADRVPRIERAVADHPDATSKVNAYAPNRWSVDYYYDGDRIGTVTVEDSSRKVVEAWTGPQVAWQMARGVPGAFGRQINAVYVWVPLMVLFFFGLFDWRRWRRLVHLDLLVLLSFAVSQYFFNRGQIDVSVPLVYPVLAYLLARLLMIAFRPRPPGSWRPSLPIPWMLVVLVFLCTFRIAMNVTDSNVIDVGYSGVIGADRIVDGEPLYGHFPEGNRNGDTYGPVNYYAYVPAEQVFPWQGTWDDLPAAHLAAVLFDLATLAGLLLLGRRIRPGPAGWRLGVTLAFAWAAFPYTLYVMNSNANDSLVAALLVFTLVGAARPAVRGMLAALAAATKFAPLALAPLLASYRSSNSADSRARNVTVFVATMVVTLVIVCVPVIATGSLDEFYDRTVGFQLGRGSPFSLWGQYHDLDWLQTTLKVAAVVLAIGVAFVPKQKTLITVAALGAAVLIALQLTLTHWFYLYIVWWLPLALVALLASEPGSAAARSTRPDPVTNRPAESSPSSP